MAAKITKIRSFIAGVAALALVVLLAAFALAAMNIRVPVLSAITDAFGVGTQ